MGNSMSEVVETMEKHAVKKAKESNHMPTPEGEEWKAIVSHYKLPPIEQVDDVMSKVTLPNGWKTCIDENDPYKRNVLIKDENNERIGSYFLKNTGYDYYGHTSFDRKKLVEKGIMKK